MRIFETEISIDTKNSIEFIDISGDIAKALVSSGIKSGLLTAISGHTTACLKITERCERLQEDMTAFLKDVVPAKEYLHDADTVDARPNARMHIMALFMSSDETVPVTNGKLELGTWQSIFFVELDGPRVGRRVKIKIVGE